MWVYKGGVDNVRIQRTIHIYENILQSPNTGAGNVKTGLTQASDMPVLSRYSHFAYHQTTLFTPTAKCGYLGMNSSMPAWHWPLRFRGGTPKTYSASG